MLAHLLTALGIYVGTYGAAHFYFYFRLTRAFPIFRGHRSVVAALLALMVCLPIAILSGQGSLPDLLILVLHPVAFAWMGFLFLFCCLGLLGEGVILVGLLARWAVLRRLSPAPALARAVVAANLAVSLLLSLYAAVLAALPRVESLTIRTAKLPPGADRVRIVHLADVHIGATFRGARLDRAMRIVTQLQPDLVVSTGDLIDGRMGLADRRLADALLALAPRYGKFACLGNHEFYAGERSAEAFARAAGFRVLRNEGLRAADGLLTIVGVDDSGHGIAQHATDAAEETILPAFREDSFLLLLKHRPDVAQASIGVVDLQLSGHTHGGQMVPFHFLVRLVYPAPTGLSDAGQGSLLYLSRGLGTWGPPMRLGVPPEIAVIDLVHASP